MGKITIKLEKETIPVGFSDKFHSKSFIVKVPDNLLTPGTDNLKNANDWKNNDKLKVYLMSILCFKDQIASILELADILNPDVTAIGDHELEIKFKGKTVKANLLLRDKNGKETRVVVEEDAIAPLTERERDLIDAAMIEALEINGDLDIDAQVKLGDAICGALGGRYPTHSRGGGHKGSFVESKSLQQQLSNIAANLSSNKLQSLRAHLVENYSPLYI